VLCCHGVAPLPRDSPLTRSVPIDESTGGQSPRGGRPSPSRLTVASRGSSRSSAPS